MKQQMPEPGEVTITAVAAEEEAVEAEVAAVISPSFSD